MVFLLHAGRLPLAISRIVSHNRILCEATFTKTESSRAGSGDISFLQELRSPGKNRSKYRKKLQDYRCNMLNIHGSIMFLMQARTDI